VCPYVRLYVTGCDLEKSFVFVTYTLVWLYIGNVARSRCCYHIPLIAEIYGLSSRGNSDDLESPSRSFILQARYLLSWNVEWVFAPRGALAHAWYITAERHVFRVTWPLYVSWNSRLQWKIETFLQVSTNRNSYVSHRGTIVNVLEWP